LLHQVHRQFKVLRANQLRVSDLTYILTWQGLSMRPLIDMFVRRIVGWGVSNSMRTDIVLAVLEQALYARQPEYDNNLIHHSDTGSRYVSFAKASVSPNQASSPLWVVRAMSSSMTSRQAAAENSPHHPCFKPFFKIMAIFRRAVAVRARCISDKRR
jgi:hypothetical protein